MAWDPFDELESLRREVDRAFETFVSGAAPFARVAFLPGRGPRRYPLVNLHEDKEHLYVEALSPGVEPDSFNVTVVHNSLTISGEKRHAPHDAKSEAFHRSERAGGKFVRTIELPVEVDETNVKADYRNGILSVALPKTEKSKPKQITVRVDET
jgi:HSP20 family protein